MIRVSLFLTFVALPVLPVSDLEDTEHDAVRTRLILHDTAKPDCGIPMCKYRMYGTLRS